MIDYRVKAGEYLLENTIFNSPRLKNLELSFSATCDKACYYCYLKKNGDKLYPTVDKDIILKNLYIFLEHLYVQGYKFEAIDIFSGEFFNLSYWEEALDIILNSKFTNYNSIVIPTNFSFVDKGLVDKVENYKNCFEKRGKRFVLSCSIDSDKDYITRPNINHIHSDIKSIITTIERLNAGMHPMVSPKFLEDYKSNVDFWIDVTLSLNRSPMFLEVRDDFWDTSSLKNYKDFLEYLAEQYFTKVFLEDSFKFAHAFFKNDCIDCYNCSILQFPTILQRMSCAFHSTIYVRLSDLALIPCHRLAYPHFIYGHFVKDNGTLKFKSDNLDFHITATTFNPSSFLPKCSECSMKAFCPKGCLGSQFETNNDPFVPIESVCNLYKTKYITLNNIAKKYGLYDIYFANPSLTPNEEAWARYVITILNELGKTEGLYCQ